MALPSQLAQSVRSRSNMYRRKRHKRRPTLLVLLAIAAVSFLAWVFIPSDNTPLTPEPAQSIAHIPNESNAVDSTTIDQNLGGMGEIIDPTNETALSGTNPASHNPEPDAVVMGQGTTPRESPRSTSTGRPAITPRNAQSRPLPRESLPTASIPIPTTISPPRAANASGRVQQLLKRGWEHLSMNRPVEARRDLSMVLNSGLLTRQDRDQIRTTLIDLNKKLVFSPYEADGDPFVLSYVIQSGDVLSSIVKRFALQVDWRFIQRINNISDPGRIRRGQRIKLITGPFHAVVRKEDFRMDLYLGDDDNRVFVSSYPVGLGELNSTPEGMFRIRPDSKLINPEWPDPRSNRIYAADDPLNPIGERWLGLQGLDERTRDLLGYGIHGTIDPQSIGKETSMGCVRMYAKDVEIIYEVLTESVSLVRITE